MAVTDLTQLLYNPQSSDTVTVHTCTHTHTRRINR